MKYNEGPFIHLGQLKVTVDLSVGGSAVCRSTATSAYIRTELTSMSVSFGGLVCLTQSISCNIPTIPLRESIRRDRVISISCGLLFCAFCGCRCSSRASLDSCYCLAGQIREKLETASSVRHFMLSSKRRTHSPGIVSEGHGAFRHKLQQAAAA